MSSKEKIHICLCVYLIWFAGVSDLLCYQMAVAQKKKQKTKHGTLVIGHMDQHLFAPVSC